LFIGPDGLGRFVGADGFSDHCHSPCLATLTSYNMNPSRCNDRRPARLNFSVRLCLTGKKQ
jgi:hypothetical protein